MDTNCEREIAEKDPECVKRHPNHMREQHCKKGCLLKSLPINNIKHQCNCYLCSFYILGAIHILRNRGQGGGSPRFITILHRGGSDRFITVLHRGGQAD